WFSPRQGGAQGASGAVTVERLYDALNTGILWMKLARSLASFAALSLGLTACATAETPPRGAIPGPALWQLADEDTTIYLFGTVHALPKDKDWFDSRIERAFAAADELVT